MKSTKTNANVWIDLTDMAVWRGHYTGIQRVTYNYAEQYAKDGAKFFLYDQIEKRYVEVPFDLLQIVRTIEKKAPLTKRQKLKYSVGKPYYMLPPQLKVYFRPGVKVFNHVTRRVASEIFDKQKRRSAFHEYPTAQFAKDDKVLLIGAGWNNESVFDDLVVHRNEIGFKIIQHINDILPVYQPHLFADELPRIFKPYIDAVLKNADMITVISQATKNDIIAYAQQHELPVPTLNVVRLGEDIKHKSSTKPASIPIAKQYLLCVGTFEIRKNYHLIYQAAKLAQLEGKSLPQIIIAGKKGWLTEDLAHVLEKDPYIKDKLIWAEGLSDEELDWLFKHCAFTLFPSICEGWGLPVVESLQHGKLCLASGVSSMLEIGNGLIDYFPPYDARACMDMIISYTKDDAYLAANRRIGEEYEVYTWGKSYESFRSAVESV